MPTLKLIFERQWLHALLLAVLLVPLAVLSQYEALQVGQLFGVPTPVWFWLAVVVPIVHQVYVWFCWRTELHAKLLSRTFSRHGFDLYCVGFAILGLTRIATVFLLAAANRDTLQANLTLLRTLAVVAAVPAVYLFYSVARYFGFRRAMGADHFDESYRSMPFVRRGIFRFTSNGMYVFGFFLLWLPGLWWASTAALVVAAFNHLYIWVHYFTTERPDMRSIYECDDRFQPEHRHARRQKE